MLGKIEGKKRMGWHYQLNGRGFEQTLGDSEGQETLMWCSPRGRKESDTTEQLNNNRAGSHLCNIVIVQW